jgi:large subunit ribosomal protein L13e
LLLYQAAGISRKYAPTVGIVVDARRQNLSEETLKLNVERLKEYQKRLIVIPRRSGKTKTGDGSAAEVKKVKKGEEVSSHVLLALPLPEKVAVLTVKKSEVDATEKAYTKLRVARSDARLVGVREKRAKAKTDEENAKKK